MHLSTGGEWRWRELRAASNERVAGRTAANRVLWAAAAQHRARSNRIRRLSVPTTIPYSAAPTVEFRMIRFSPTLRRALAGAAGAVVVSLPLAAQNVVQQGWN